MDGWNELKKNVLMLRKLTDILIVRVFLFEDIHGHIMTLGATSSQQHLLSSSVIFLFDLLQTFVLGFLDVLLLKFSFPGIRIGNPQNQ